MRTAACSLTHIYIYPPRAFRHMLRVPVRRELHPQPEFYEFPVGVGSSRWRWELQPLPLEFLKGGTRDPGPELHRSLPPSRPPKIQLFRSSTASCALVRQPWRQDVQTSPKIAKKTPSWSQHLSTKPPKRFQDSLQDPPEEAPILKKTKVM